MLMAVSAPSISEAVDRQEVFFTGAGFGANQNRS
jgi:hypothetical protein